MGHRAHGPPTDPLVSPAPALAPLIKLLGSSGWLAQHLSRQRIEPLNSVKEGPRTLLYGVGCSTRGGPSMALPIESLVLHLVAMQIVRVLAVSKVICFIGTSMGRREMDREERAILNARIADHRALLERVRAVFGFAPEVVLDRDFLSSRATISRSLKQLAGAEAAANPNLQYWVGQHLMVDTLRRRFGTSLKLGWTLLDGKEANAAEERLAKGQLPKSWCEGSFDSLSRVLDTPGTPRIGFVYTRAARTFDPGRPHGCPYATRNPLGRVLLSDTRSDLSTVVPDPLQLEGSERALRACAGIESLAELLELVASVSPNLGRLPEDNWLAAVERDLRRAAESRQEAVRKHGANSAEFRAAGTRVNSLRIARCHRLRQLMFPGLMEVRRAFALE